MSTLYVYAFTSSPIVPFSLGGRRIRSLDIEGIHVVIDRALPAERTSEASLRRQHAIVEAIAARADAVLPARAGSAIDDGALRARIASGKATLATALDLVRGREQMTLRLAAAPLPAPSAAATSGTAYLQARRAAAAPPGEWLALVRSLVAGLVHGEHVQPARGVVPAAVFHLIQKGDAAEYRRRIEGAPALAGARPQVTGPFPPFAFTPELAG
jgi:hypothetical protein